ncbi:hypothetical protein DMN91_006541 [Ooceraea biroi]|uniref:Fork-head domain-containing protein n=1 Tax=Ooceraea biroi TaxID=2015173 RepID=A0A3L8DP36_OOCBI|nr:hypothetical protein DMN91_006541 [Ooceraea biroi]
MEGEDDEDDEIGDAKETRARSNTWPLPRPEGYVEGNAPAGNEGAEGGTPPHQTQLAQGGLLPVKKNSSRRNAWGNLSYADLITPAITSAPDQRLTLSQIYEWMVQNVSYFKDKGDNNSSAGWKSRFRIRSGYVKNTEMTETQRGKPDLESLICDQLLEERDGFAGFAVTFAK